MAEAYVGEIRLFSFNFAPDGWLLCQGQQLAVNGYQALFALIGSTYGGDGQTTFNLPDLRGRIPTQWGQGPITTYPWAQKGGTSTTTIDTFGTVVLTTAQLPAHTHAAAFTGTGGGTAAQPTITVKVSTDSATVSAAPANGYLAVAKPSGPGAAPFVYSGTATSGTTALNSTTAVATGGSGGGITGGTVTVANTGTGQPVVVPVSVGIPPMMPPFLAMNYAICINGYFPPRP